MTNWTADHVPAQQGRTAVITGANTGLGLETARVLASKGASVVLAVRNLDKGKDAVTRIADAVPGADVSVQKLDLASLDSVRTAATELSDRFGSIDLLVNNAGVMWTPETRTADGFELQLGTNHLGPFAFTGLLLDRLLAADNARVVTVSSNGHKLLGAHINLDDLQSERKYSKYAAYGQAKLANLLFTYELQRRLAAQDASTIAVAAHPGNARSELTRNSNLAIRGLIAVAGGLIYQDTDMGALPILRAATDPTVTGGEYYGPGGRGEVKGHPKAVESSEQSHDRELQRRLWSVSEELTGVSFPV